ncbi:MAG TPA: hypothetical protein VH682_27380, partial [Gemmataceae bacterium]
SPSLISGSSRWKMTAPTVNQRKTSSAGGLPVQAFTPHIPDGLVARALEPVPCIDSMVRSDERGRQDFRLLMRGGGNQHYAVFGVLWLNGNDLRKCPLSRRKCMLSRLATKTSTTLSPVFGVRGRGRTYSLRSSGLTWRVP